MKTENKEKIEKATRLLNIINARRTLEKQESELKDYFKGEIKDGFLEAGSIVIMIERKTRASIDKKMLEVELGLDAAKRFERITEYEQVTVKERN